MHRTLDVERASRLTLGQSVVDIGLFVLSFLLHFLVFFPPNDRFERLSRARQIARYGELPFRDFLDPGYFLTLFSSAAAQRLLGDNLLGEALLSSEPRTYPKNYRDSDGVCGASSTSRSSVPG